MPDEYTAADIADAVRIGVECGRQAELHNQLAELVEQLRAKGWTREQVLSFVTAVLDGDA